MATVTKSQNHYMAIPNGVTLQSNANGTAKGITLAGVWHIVPKGLVPQFEKGGVSHLLYEVRSNDSKVTSIGADGKPVLEKLEVPTELRFVTGFFASAKEAIKIAKSDELFNVEAKVFVKSEEKRLMEEYKVDAKDLTATI